MLNRLLSLLILTAPESRFQGQVDDSLEDIRRTMVALVTGKAAQVVENQFRPFLYSGTARAILTKYPSQDLNSVLDEYLAHVQVSLDAHFGETGKIHFHLLAIAYLQTFLQINYTGPSVLLSQDSMFPDTPTIQQDAVQLLGLEGQLAYDLMTGPVFLVIASKMLEMQMHTSHSLVTMQLVDTRQSMHEVTGFMNKLDPFSASVVWWRSRVLQAHLSVLPEPPSVIGAISPLLLGPKVLEVLSPNEPEIRQLLHVTYLLENARFHVHSRTEHLCVPLLAQAREVSGLELVLTGAKAKRTKFQQFSTSNLLVLAKSGGTSFYETETETVESFDLNSDVLLETPHFESLEDLQIDDRDAKRIKFSSFEDSANEPERLLPIVTKQDDIPTSLIELDPNQQPRLSDLDNVQLLLRFTALKQTSPWDNPLVSEELMALITRVLSPTHVNWLVYSRGLWERSLLETAKPKTIERGILQMTSLVEEIGIKVKSRIIPQNGEDDSASLMPRLRFIHQLPLMPQWAMDTQLAEKYMSLGVLRSALEIYQRLNLLCEAALCYAAVDNEPEAKKLLLHRLETHPHDARAISILGDLQQDPQLWEKAWEIGKYPRAKASLARYYYSPPPGKGPKSIQLAIEHMNECLKANPLSYENWFFYGCCGLETLQFELAAEAFSRCVALDDTNSHTWSNLSIALLKLDKPRAAFNALKKALSAAKENKRSWKIYENYVLVAMQLHEWSDVLHGTRELVQMRTDKGESVVDIPVVEKLAEILVSSELNQERMSHYQSSCVDLICNIIPQVLTESYRCWRVVAKVELWRRKPWNALDCYEKGYRAVCNRSDLITSETVWNDAVSACSDLVAAYESLGELPGKYNADDIVCKDWKYKAKSSIRGLMSKGKQTWQDSPGWDKLQELKSEFM